MPNRILKETICTSENIEKLSAFQETVFYRIIVNCDDFGRLDARPKILASRLFPLKDIRAAQIENALRALSLAELVILYEVDGKPFLQMATWDKHQTIRAKKSKYPAPSESNCKQLQADDFNCKQMQADASKCSRNPIQSESNPNPNPNPNPMRDAHDAVLEKWNSIGIGTVRGLSGTREQHLDARIREHGLATVLEAIDHVSRSAFLKGKNNRGWKISFDWFLNPNNFQKVLEGNYDSEAKTQKVDIGELLKGVDNI